MKRISKKILNLLICVPVLILALSSCQIVTLDEPENVSASDGTLENVIEVTWDEVEGKSLLPVNVKADYYRVYRSTTSTIEYDLFYQVGTDIIETSFVDEEVESGEIYYYKVKAFTDSGISSDFSEMDEGYAAGGYTVQDFWYNVYIPAMSYARSCKFYPRISFLISAHYLYKDHWFWGDASGRTGDYLEEDPAEYDPYTDPYLEYPDTVNPLASSPECAADPMCDWMTPDDWMYYPWKPCDGQTADGVVTIPPFEHPDNTMHWTRILQPWGLVYHVWEFTNYNDGDLGNGSLIINGTLTAVVTTDGDGIQTGTLTLNGLHEVEVHYIIEERSVVVDPDPETGSWTKCTYNGIVQRFEYTVEDDTSALCE